MHNIETCQIKYRGNDDGIQMPLDIAINQCGHHPLKVRSVTRTHRTPPISRLFLFTNGGHCDLLFGEQKHHLGPDRFWLIPLHHTLRITYPPQGHLHFVHFTARATGGIDLFSGQAAPLSLPPMPVLQNRFLSAFAGESADQALLLQSAIIEIVARFVANPAIMARWREDSLDKPFRAVLAHIRARNHHGVTYGALAEVAGMRPDTLRKGFRRNMGVSLKSYLLSDLMQKALDLLIGTDLRVREISERLGFDDVCYFEHAFTRIVGMPPLRYRKNSQEWIHRWRHPVANTGAKTAGF